jgi:multimeric flavodoxin WrbA
MSQKNVVILNGSPRKNGNTNVLVKFIEEHLQQAGWNKQFYHLPEMNFKGCMHCDACQKVETQPGCILNDDLKAVLDQIAAADAIILVSPVHCWSVSGSLSTALDRFYSFFKFKNNTSIIKGKKMIGVFTSGGDHFDGMDLCVEMAKRLCDASEAEYVGSLTAANCTTPDELHNRPELKTMAKNLVDTL